MADAKYGRVFTAADMPALQDAMQRVDSHRRVLTVDEWTMEVLEALDDSDMTFPSNEPLFVLRGRDSATVQTVQDYLGNVRDAGADEQHIAAVREHLARIEAWQQSNATRVAD